MKVRPLFTVSRASNGWLVTLHDGFYVAERTILCLTWEEVEKVTRAEAFPYPDKNEPRGP